MKFKYTAAALLTLFTLNVHAETFKLSSNITSGEKFDISNKKIEKEVPPVGNLYLSDKNKEGYDFSYIYVSPEEHKINGTLDLKTFKDKDSCVDFLKTETENTQKTYNVEPQDFQGSAKRFIDKESENSKNIILNCDENNTFAYIVLDQEQIDKNK